MRTSFLLSGPSRQRGVVLIFALVALAIMMIGAVAVVRSMNTSQFSIGNLGFKRDMANQAERALLKVQTEFTTGALAKPISRESSQVASNYSATILPTNAQGLPLALINDAAFPGVGVAANDIDLVNEKITIRYVVDRLAQASPIPGPVPCVPETCIVGNTVDRISGRSFSELEGAQPPPLPLYRLTVRVVGPRGTLSFFQSTFTL